jgi:hypothetical protein
MDSAFSFGLSTRLAVKAALPASGFFALLAGTAVYLLDRDWTTALFLAPFSAWQPDLNLSLGFTGNSLPSLCHAYAFALLIILALWPARHARLAGAVSWLLIAAALECLQAEAMHEWVADGIGVLAGFPFADHFLAYTVNGHFDTADLVATVFGVLVAYIATSVLERQP